MARPREFEIDQAIEKAMHLFWQLGYHATNLPELLTAMEISRGSFYKAFDSKKDVFLRALALYEMRNVTPGIALLEDASLSGQEAISRLFGSAQQAIEDGDKRGCLLCSAAAETAYHDAEIAQAVNTQLNALTGAFAMALSRGTSLPNIPTADQKAEAKRLAQRYVGLRVMQRSGVRTV
ncbi:MAG: helix-turn-helix domain-containing protein [Pseudomonadota bacterium]